MFGRPLSGRRLSGRKLSGSGLSTRGRGGGGPSDFVPPPSIQLSGLSIAEDAAGEAEIGTASVANGSGTYAFSITSDPDSKFSIVEATGVLSLGAEATLDYETATSHQVTIQADNGVDDPISRTFTITVTNVIEAPVNVTPPAVTGSVEVGSTLSCSTGSWTDMESGSYAYQWKDAADDSDIDGATSSTLLLEREQAGLELYCSVIPTNSAGSGTPEPSNTVGPVPAIVPAAFVLADWDLDAGDEEADVTINDLPDDGGDTITDVEYRLDGGSWVSSGGTTSFTISGLTNDQEYDVELRAVNGVGAGAASDVKSVTPEDTAGVPVAGATASYYASDFASLSDSDRIALWSDSENSYDLVEVTTGSSIRPYWDATEQQVCFPDPGRVQNTSLPWNRQSISFLWIGRFQSVDTNGRMFTCNVGGIDIIVEVNAGVFRVYGGSFKTSTLKAASYRTIALLVTLSASAVNIYLDSASNVYSSTAFGSGSGTGFEIGNTQTGNLSARQSIAELHVWPFALDSSQAASVLDYAATKYGTGLLAGTPDGYAIFEGDSITNGLASTLLRGWPLYVGPYGNWVAVNMAVVGAALSGGAVPMIGEQAAEINTPYANGTNWLFVWGGTNDHTAGATGAEIEDRLRTYCEAAITAGFDKSHIVVFTLTLSASGDGITRRDDANTAIRANYTDYAGWLVDVAADANLGVTPGVGGHSGTYYADSFHLSPAGHVALGALVRSVVTLPWE